MLQNQPYDEINNKTSYVETRNVSNSCDNIFIKHLFVDSTYTFQTYDFILITKS